MLESFNTDAFTYKRLTEEEQNKRGILGRLVGVIADTVNPTRNNRKYSASLWEKVFEDPIMKERIENRCCFGELGHPADREETDMEKIALCLAEQPKKGKDGKLYGVFDILSTPNGRILKTLCDYGCNIGISSRGSGDLYTDENGDESVDEDTYDCQGFDAVLIPAVKEARLEYVTESLNKVRYSKSLKEKLQESLSKASEDDKKVMKESLDTLGITLNEDDLHQVFRKDAKDQYKNFSAKKAKYDAQADKLQKDLKDLGETDPEKINYYKDIIIGDEPVFKYRKGHNSLERQNYPFYVTVYEGTSYFHPEEGGYYQAGLEPVYSEGYQSFEEAQSALQDYLKENGSTTVSFNPSNLPADDDNYSYAESEEEYKPLYDSKDRLIGAIASGKYIGEEEQVWVESNKQYLKRQVGYKAYESLNEDNFGKKLSKKDFYFANDRPEEKEKVDLDAAELQELSRDEIEDILDAAGNESTITNIYDVWWAQRTLKDGKIPTPSIVEKRSVVKQNYYAPIPTKYYDEEWKISGSKTHEYELSRIIKGKSKYYIVSDEPPTLDQIENRVVEENLTESAESIRNSMQKLHDYLVQWYDENIAPETAGNAQKAGWDEELDQAWLMLVNLALPDDIKECSNTAVDNNEAMVEELQKSLKRVKELQNKLVGLQEKLSVSYAKESKLQEDLNKNKSTILKLTKTANQLPALKKRLTSLEENKKLLESKLITSKSANKKLQESIEKSTVDNKSLQEKLTRKDMSAQKLTEKISTLTTENEKLKESISSMKKDSELSKSNYSKKLEESNKLVEKYKRIATKSVDKYIDLQAVKLGVTSAEIKNRLPESYNFNDIDETCEGLKQYRVNLNKLPFNTMFNEELKIKATPSKKDILSDINSAYDDEIDDQLLSWAKIK